MHHLFPFIGDVSTQPSEPVQGGKGLDQVRAFFLFRAVLYGLRRWIVAHFFLRHGGMQNITGQVFATRLILRIYLLPREGLLRRVLSAHRAKLGTAHAITATAHKIARILYHVLLTKEPYAETVFHRCDEQAQRRAEMRLRK
jgi:hypothetical protein